MKKEFAQHTATNFIKNKDFLLWIKEDKNATDWANWLHAYPQQRDVLAKSVELLQDTPYAPTKARLQELEAIIYPQPQTMAMAKAKPRKRISYEPLDLPESTNRNNPFKRWLPLLAAACLVLPLGLFFFMPGDQKTMVAKRGERPSASLPDGSIVHLNADSELRYDYKSWDEKREVELVGEAFFEVKKGSTFVVNTSSGKMKTASANFNVNAREGSLEVACFRGDIEVKNKQNGKTESLKIQQQVAVAGNTLEKSNFDRSAYATWRKGTFYYKEKPASTILREIERQYNVHIKAPKSLKYKPIDFHFDLREPLDHTLASVRNALNVEIEVREDTILLSEIKSLTRLH